MSHGGTDGVRKGFKGEEQCLGESREESKSNVTICKACLSSAELREVARVETSDFD